MNERFNFGRVGKGLAVLTVALSACTVSSTPDNQTIATTKPTSSRPILKGKDYEIIKIGKTIYEVTGVDQEGGINFMAGRCNIKSVGMWQNDGKTTEHVVAVELDICMPELFK